MLHRKDVVAKLITVDQKLRPLHKSEQHTAEDQQLEHFGFAVVSVKFGDFPFVFLNYLPLAATYSKDVYLLVFPGKQIGWKRVWIVSS